MVSHFTSNVGEQRKVRVEQATIIMITLAWQGQPWYPTLLQMSIKNPLLLPRKVNLLTNPDGEFHPLALNYSSTSGLNSFRKQLVGEGISENAVQLISAARRGGTVAHYESVWRKFCCWSNSKQIYVGF